MQEAPRRDPGHWAIAAVTALAFADSAIVVLALPDLVTRFDASVSDVSWVIAAFNLAAAATAVALAVARVRATLAGAIVFAGASLVCALTPSLLVLDLARAAQGVGAAIILIGTAALLPVRTWSIAGALGFAVGPALGGILTQLAGWRWIFALQVPAALVFALALRGSPRRREAVAGRDARNARLPSPVDGAVLLVSAALVGALFLSVVLLVNAWSFSPIAAAGMLTAVPVAALATAVLARGLPPAVDAAVGAVLIAGGLGILALLGGESVPLALLALAVAGGGVGLALGPGLAHLGPAPHAAGSTWSIAARHAGLMLGVVVMAPLLNNGLSPVRNRAIARGVSTLAVAPLPVTQKLVLGVDLAHSISSTPRMTLPDLDPPFRRARDRAGSGGERSALTSLEGQFVTILQEELTGAFHRSFGVAALLSLGALPLIAVAALQRNRRRT
jgi:MFS family permease